MWRLVRAGREHFVLTDGELGDFVRRVVTELLKAGAVPVVGDKAAAFGWSPVLKQGNDPAGAADAPVREWVNAGVDTNADGIWFAFPVVWK